MIKKLLLILGLLIMFDGSAFALSNPRWAYFPLNIAIQTNSKTAAKAMIVEKAFKTWQLNAGSVLKFTYKSSGPFQVSSPVNIYFVENLAQNAYYEVEQNTAGAVWNNMNYNRQGFFTHTNIKFRINEPDGKKISDAKFYAIALQAAGKAMGINCLDTTGDAMSCTTTFNSKNVTKNDIEALFDIYKQNRNRGKK